MSLRIVRLGSPRSPGEGLRIGAVRRPPRGVPKAQIAAQDWYDQWFPNLAPSAELVKQALAAQRDGDERAWAAFVRAFRRELAAPERVHELALIAALSHTADFSLGCYCEDEARCHRSVLRALLAAQGAEIV